LLNADGPDRNGNTDMDVGSLVYLFVTAISLLVLFAIIRGAVRSALEEHYKTVRWYEQTGEWAGRHAPRAFETAAAAKAQAK
jgi:hypothetical protein